MVKLILIGKDARRKLWASLLRVRRLSTGCLSDPAALLEKAVTYPERNVLQGYFMNRPYRMCSPLGGTFFGGTCFSGPMNTD